jgi:predicted AlkP superfamily phosphohydrolase/phosphomutase
VQHEHDSPFAEAIRDYYLHLDHEIGQVLDLLDEETLVLVASDHGAQRLDGGFCVNEFLIQSGLLVLHEYPDKPTPFSQLSVDWDRTTVWSEGGYYARIFMNVQGREPRGTIAAADYQRVRNELQARLEATAGPDGKLLGTKVFQPDAIYRRVEGIAPDLIVHFGGLFWRSIGSVGHGCLHVQENDTGPDDCNHAQFGAFVLNGPGVAARGRVTGVHLLDMAPTLLELSGHDVPIAMQGRVMADERPSPVSHSRLPILTGN